MENRAKYRSAAKIKIDSFDDLFGENPTQGVSGEQIVNVALTDLYPFKNHPFRVADDEKMEETAESIEKKATAIPLALDGGLR